MARLEYFLVSKSSSVDIVTNEISAFEILEEIHVADFPVIYPGCVAITVLRLEEGDEEKDFQGLLCITTPSGDTNEHRVNFRMTSTRHRLIQRLVGLPLTEAGVLKFEIKLNDKHLAEHFVDVHHSGPLDTTGSAVTPA